MIQAPLDTVRVAADGSLTGDLTIGIVSGLVTGLLIFLFAGLWRRVIVPWYEARVYRGLDVSGEWQQGAADQLTLPDFEWGQDETLQIKQTAHRLTGIATLRPRDPAPGEPTESRVLEFEGIIADGYVNARMRSPNRKRLGQVAMLMQVVGDGTRMEGQVSYYDVGAKVIASAPVVYVRRG